jgi:hypothetical protein
MVSSQRGCNPLRIATFDRLKRGAIAEPRLGDRQEFLESVARRGSKPQIDNLAKLAKAFGHGRTARSACPTVRPPTVQNSTHALVRQCRGQANGARIDRAGHMRRVRCGLPHTRLCAKTTDNCHDAEIAHTNLMRRAAKSTIWRSSQPCRQR